MAKIFKNEMEGESLKYIKYKKYFTQRAKIRPEKSLDQCLAISKSIQHEMHLERSYSAFIKGQKFT